VFITVGRPSLAAAISSVLAQDHRPLEMILFANGAAVDVDALPHDDGVPVRTGGSPHNLGVAGGRNAAARLAGGEHLLFVDDDAVLHEGAITAAVGRLEASPEVGAVAFRIVDPSSGRPTLWYHPYDREQFTRRDFEASTVIGCAAMFRRHAFDALGGFWDGYFRDFEEVDLSWRLIDAGWTIRYEPGAVVEHIDRLLHTEPSTRSNLLAVWRLLPPGLMVRQTVVKLCVFAVRAAANRQLRQFASGVVGAVRLAPRARRERSVLSEATIAYLRRVHAPQGYGKRLQWSLRPLAPPAPRGGQPASAGDASRRT